MNKQQEALKQALEALEYLRKPIAQGWEAETQQEKRDQAITAIREALAEQPAQQEPAFWTRKQWGMDREFCEKPFTTDWEPLYTSPPAQRKPLTDEEIDDIWNRYCDEMGEASINDALDIARAIEAAHGI